MNAREIPAAQWADVLDQFSREHRAWLATIDRVRPGAGDDTEAVERRLAAVLPRMTGHRVARIEIRFEQDSQERAPIEIDAPTGIRVEETPEGVTSGLEITDSAGERTHVRFRAAPKAEMLDGIAPGEMYPTS